MREHIVAERYAEAYVLFNGGAAALSGTLGEFKLIKKILHEVPRFISFLKNPCVPESEKFEFIDKILHHIFSERLREFLKLVIEKRRVSLLPIMAEHIRAKYSHGEVMHASLFTAASLDQSELHLVKRALEKKFTKKMDLHVERDPSLLGGVRFTSGNTIIDGSVKNRFAELREKLINVKVA